MPEHFDILVLGAGPAGLAAARTAARSGLTVGLVDEQPAPGGQIGRRPIWLRPSRLRPSRAFRETVDALRSDSRITYFPGERVVACEKGPALVTETPYGCAMLTGGSLILATGARELVLPFPGWTLPGVMALGGLQVLAKGGWPVAGGGIVLAGSGPLLLASARTLRQAGAQIHAIVEQASRQAVLRFLAGLPAWPTKVLQTLAFAPGMLRMGYETDAFVVEALGQGVLEAVRIESRGRRRIVPCSYLGIGMGLIPNVEAARGLGCALEGNPHPAVAVNAFHETSQRGIYAAGEITGIGGAELARLEGAIAGYAAAGNLTRAQALSARRAHWMRFGAHLMRQFALRDSIRQLAEPMTIICRCEDVTLGAIDQVSDAGTLKLLTRLGMGACQGRMCQPALAELRPRYRLGATSGIPRPPLFPARLETLAGLAPGEPL